MWGCVLVLVSRKNVITTQREFTSEGNEGPKKKRISERTVTGSEVSYQTQGKRVGSNYHFHNGRAPKR